MAELHKVRRPIHQRAANCRREQCLKPHSLTPFGAPAELSCSCNPARSPVGLKDSRVSGASVAEVELGARRTVPPSTAELSTGNQIGYPMDRRERCDSAGQLAPQPCDAGQGIENPRTLPGRCPGDERGAVLRGLRQRPFWRRVGYSARRMSRPAPKRVSTVPVTWKPQET